MVILSQSKIGAAHPLTVFQNECIVPEKLWEFYNKTAEGYDIH